MPPQRQPAAKRRTAKTGFLASRGMGEAQGRKVQGAAVAARHSRRSRHPARQPSTRPLGCPDRGDRNRELFSFERRGIARLRIAICTGRRRLAFEACPGERPPPPSRSKAPRDRATCADDLGRAHPSASCPPPPRHPAGPHPAKVRTTSESMQLCAAHDAFEPCAPATGRRLSSWRKGCRARRSWIPHRDIPFIFYSIRREIRAGATQFEARNGDLASPRARPVIQSGCSRRCSTRSSAQRRAGDRGRLCEP